jgi:hypothetical protein
MSSIPSVSSSVFVAQSVAAQAQAAPALPPKSGSDDGSSKETAGGRTAGRRLDVTA